MKRQYNHITAAELARWAQLRKDGMTYAAIARQVGRHHESVRRALRMYDRDSKVDMRHEEPEYIGKMRRAFTLRNQQWTYSEIAHAIDWHASLNSLRNGLVRYARRNGMPLFKVEHNSRPQQKAAS